MLGGHIVLAQGGQFCWYLHQKKQQLSLLVEKKSIENDLKNVQKELSEYISKIELQALEEMHWGEVRINTPEKMNQFMDLFSKLHPGFIQKIKDSLSKITPGELRFLCLSKIKLTDNQMSNILGVNPNTIRQTRKRLKDKLILETNGSMLEFIDSLN